MMSTQVFMMDSVSKRLNKFRLVVLMVFTDLQICLAISSTVLALADNRRISCSVSFCLFISFLPQSWHYISDS